VTNVVRHARASGLVLTVEVGANLEQRAAGLGGTCSATVEPS
jgi:hypothetical protein